MPGRQHKKRFLNLPKYTGGSEAFREFISTHLRYPEAALDAMVEGTVMVEYDVHDNGTVHNPRILHGIGHGCDEEAMRVVGLLRYEKVKNRGVRVKMTTKTGINFRLPRGVQIRYSSTEQADPKKENDPGHDKPGPVNYEYTISI